MIPKYIFYQHGARSHCSLPVFTVLRDPNLKRAGVDGVNGILWPYVRYMGVGRIPKLETLSYLSPSLVHVISY